jgi:cellulose synthase operon protein C
MSSADIESMGAFVTPFSSDLSAVVQEVCPRGLASPYRLPGSSKVTSGFVDCGKSWNGRGDVMSGLRLSRNGGGMLVRSLLWLGLAGLAVVPGNSAAAQGPNRGAPKFIPDSSDPAANFLRIASEHAKGEKWSEAIQMYQRVIEQYGNKVAALPAGEQDVDRSGDFVLYVDDRWYCHRVIAKLPPEAREIYRKRVDGMAERWYQQGLKTRDLAPLRRVVDQAFCSAWGDDALELLGDLAFQDGRFGEALAAYGRLVADHPQDGRALVHPDPSVDLARVAAKKLLCRAAAGENPPGPADLKDLAARYPGASGLLAGRKGPYSETLAEALGSDQLGPAHEPDNRWPTFAGSFQRTKLVPGPIDVGSMQWRVDLEKVSYGRGQGFNPRGAFGGGPVTAPQERLLAFHPIVLGEQVIVSDGARILAFNLNDRPPADTETSALRVVGPVWKYPPDDDGQIPQARHTSPGIPRYTLTAFGNRIYARMWSPSAAYFSGGGGRGSSSIVALDWSTQGKLLWEQSSTTLSLPNRPPDRNNNRTISFEGTPVADGDSVYVAVTDRREQTATYIVCFSADSGAVRWIRYVGAASPEGDNNFGFMGGMQPPVTSPGDFNHRLLSLDGPTLFYQTNLGALAAIEAATGSMLWVASYPRQEPGQFGIGSERDLNPAIIHEGRVFIAPSDADAIFAFDAQSGRLLWKSARIADDIKLSHMLGVAKGRLVASGNRVVLFDVKTGKAERPWPDSGKALDGYGRGLLAGDKIYWPTQNEIQVLDQRSGLLADQPIRLHDTYHTNGGNLVAGDGYLIVAQTDGLVVFCQNSRLIERYREQIVLNGEEASNYFRLARAAEAIGHDELALENYGTAIVKARPAESIDGVPLAGAARDQKFRLLLRLAGSARKAGKWKRAAEQLDSAGKVARSGGERLQAELLQADVLLDASRPRDAVAICQRLLADDRLRSLAVGTADGHRTVRADLLIADRLKSIVREQGRELYEPFDQEAARLVARGRKEKDPQLLDLVCRTYPEALVVPDALVALGRLYEEERRLSDASNTYKRLENLPQDDDRRVLALWRLAHVYEARQLLVSARDSYLELLARYPKRVLSDHGRQATVAELASSQLARPLFASIVAERAEPPTPVPLVRRWQWRQREGEPLKALAASGVAPSLDCGRVFLVEKTGMRLLDPLTGAQRWSVDLGAPAVWAGYLSDKLIVATSRQVTALDLLNGSVQWRYDASKARNDVDRPNPFANPADPEKRPKPSGPSLSGFQLVRGRVFCMRNRSELIALDGDTGALDWSFSSPPGEINPYLWIGAERALLQVDKPNQLLVLRTDDGRLVTRVALTDNEVLQRPPMPLDENSVVLVSDRRTVKRFDLVQGESSWVYRESEVTPTYGPPRLLGNADCLLVLHDGHLLIRLDPASGLKRWECPLAENLADRPESIAWDDKNLYCVNYERISGVPRRSIRAVGLENGLRAWAYPLSGPENAIWSIALSDRAVFAYPSAHESRDAALVSVPLSVRRRDDGALIERLVFPTATSEITFKLDPRGAILATSSGMWALSSSSK